MAELADAPDLGSGGITVQVQVLLPAPAGSTGSPISGVGIKNPNFINTTVYFGFIFILCTISSVHNGFQLWTLDSFMLNMKQSGREFFYFHKLANGRNTHRIIFSKQSIWMKLCSKVSLI